MSEPNPTPAELRERIREVERALLRERRLLVAEQERSKEATRRADARPTPQELAKVRKRLARAEKRLADVYYSRTWRVGRLAWKLFHLPAALWRRSGARDGAEEIAESKPVERKPPPAARVDYSLVESTVVRKKYQRAVDKAAFSDSQSGRNVVMAVFTSDLDENRGDLYTAVGLGRNLEEIGYEVVYLPRDRWYQPPQGTDIYVSLLETVDLGRLPEHLKTIAWIRNQTRAWLQQPWLTWYDQVLCSSQGSVDAVSEVYPGPVSLLPIGVDAELFNLRGRAEDRDGVITTVNQWGRERELYANLEQSAPITIPLAVFGERRGMSEAVAPHCRGPVSFFALPSLYNEARIVLDDFNHTTADFGNVNSRVFEAAACGAPVITNRAGGLADVGLDDLAVYGSSEDLRDMISIALESEDELKKAEERSRRVVAAHSYSVRAKQFHEVTTGAVAGSTGRTLIGAYPAYSDNPYTEMLWSSLRDVGGLPMMLSNDRDFRVFCDAAAIRPAVLHLNWTAPVLGGARDATERVERYRWFLSRIEQLQDLHVPVIWTVHNVMPHECADTRLEAKLRQELADRVDVVHVMCDSAVRECSGVFEIPSDKVRTIPHPSYIDVYPNLIDREAARFELGLAYDDTVYLYFGQVRPYKGVDLLLDAFDRLAASDPKAKLLIVGRTGRFPEIAGIKQRARAHPQVLSLFHEIPDSDVQLYMNAANIVVLPYRKALNSGALQLAYSFARPVVAAEVGCLSSQVDRTTGITFDPSGGSTALLTALQDAAELGPEHETAAYTRAAARHYRDIGRQFADLVNEALAQRSTETIR